MKKIVSTILMVLFLCLMCLGCTKHPDGWKKAKSLDEYITNYAEVEAYLCEQFNIDHISIRQRDDINSDVDTLEQFGNGYYYFTVDGVECSVGCTDHIAQEVYIDSIGSYRMPPTEFSAETITIPISQASQLYDLAKQNITYNGGSYVSPVSGPGIDCQVDVGTYTIIWQAGEYTCTQTVNITDG